MGLIYRILREFKYIFKNKKIRFFISCLIIAILFCMLSVKVFAFDVGYNDEVLTFPDFEDLAGGDYAIIYFYGWDNYYYLLKSSSPFTLNGPNSSGYYKCVSNASIKTYKLVNNNWQALGFPSVSCKADEFRYSSTDLYDTNNNLVFTGGTHLQPPEPYPLSVRVDEGDYTYINPIHAFTNWFSREDIENYSAEVSLKTDFSDSKQMYIGTLFIQESQELLCRFMYDIEHNGTYYFKITNKETGKDNYFSITVRNMLGAGTIDENGDIIPPTIEEVNEIDENKYVIGIGETAEDTNKFLKDDSVNDNEFDMPTVNVNDPTANFFDTIFTGLYNAVTSNEEKTISFDLFGNQIQINSADFNFLTDNRWSVLRFILSSAWVVGIGLYILKDIRKMIDKIKDGNIEGVANDDIKADIM